MNTVIIEHDMKVFRFILENLEELQLKNVALFLELQKEEMLGKLYDCIALEHVEGSYNRLRHINEQLEKITNYIATKSATGEGNFLDFSFHPEPVAGCG